MLVRELNKEDAVSHLDLIAQSTPFSRCYAYWRWLNRELYDKSEVYGLFEENRLIGSYAVHRLHLKFGGLSYHLGFGTQAVIHPKYRNLSRIVELMKEVEIRSANIGYDALFAFPNDNMAIVKEKVLNWKCNRVFFQSLVSKTEISEKVIVGHRILEGDLDLPIRYSDSESEIELSMPRSWLEKRYLKHPSNHYILIENRDFFSERAILVFKFYVLEQVRYLHLVDWYTESNVSPTKILALAQKIVHNFEYDYFSYWPLSSNDNDGTFGKTKLMSLLLTDRAKDLPLDMLPVKMGLSDAF